MHKVSIIIRTKNEDKMLGEVLKGIEGQDFKDREVIVVDSDSTDATLEIAARWKAKILKIPPEKFTFGYALNFGAKHADSKYICYLSGHCVPYNQKWLGALVEPMERDRKIAATYSRQLAFPHHNPLERLWLLTTFPAKREGVQCIFSNASSLIRRQVWEKYRFDEKVTGLEDYLWAREVLENKYKIVYVPESIVYHSHNENIRDFCHRAKINYLPKLQYGLQKPFSVFYLIAEMGFKVLQDYIFLLKERENLKWFLLSPLYRGAYVITIFCTQQQFKRSKK